MFMEQDKQATERMVVDVDTETADAVLKAWKADPECTTRADWLRIAIKEKLARDTGDGPIRK